MTSKDYLGYSYGAVVYGAGLAGFLAKRSKPPLLIGSLFGGLALWGAYGASSHPDEPFVAAANAGGLSAVMLARNVMDIRSGAVSSAVSRLFRNFRSC